MNRKEINRMKKDIKNTLEFFLHELEHDVVLHGGLSQCLERAVRLQVYLEMEEKNDTAKN
jgi:hypothetical protein